MTKFEGLLYFMLVTFVIAFVMCISCGSGSGKSYAELCAATSQVEQTTGTVTNTSCANTGNVEVAVVLGLVIIFIIGCIIYCYKEKNSDDNDDVWFSDGWGDDYCTV